MPVTAMVTSLLALPMRSTNQPPLHAGLVFVALVDAVVQVQQREHFAVDAGLAQRLGDQVDALDVVHREDALHRHVGVHRDLLADLLLDRVGRAAGDDVGHDAHFHQPLDAELGGLGFLLAERAGLEDVGQGDEDDGAFAFLVGELTAGFEVDAVLVVADGAADFDEDDVGVALDGQLAELQLDLRR